MSMPNLCDRKGCPPGFHCKGCSIEFFEGVWVYAFCLGEGCYHSRFCEDCSHLKKHLPMCDGDGCEEGSSCPQCEHPLQPICEKNAECASRGCLACSTGKQPRCGKESCPCPKCYGIPTKCSCTYMMLIFKAA